MMMDSVTFFCSIVVFDHKKMEDWQEEFGGYDTLPHLCRLTSVGLTLSVCPVPIFTDVFVANVGLWFSGFSKQETSTLLVHT